MNKRYKVTFTFTEYAKNDEAIRQKAELFAQTLSQANDCDCRVAEIVEVPFARIERRKVKLDEG